MQRALLLRLRSYEQGTFGRLSSEGFSCGILELPWRDNQKQKSCIPEGFYEVVWTKSPKFGFCYGLLNVPDRFKILIHKGNYAGDVDAGYISNSYGCLLPYMREGVMHGQQAGLLSAPAVSFLNRHFQQKPFLLEIKNAYNNSGAS